MRAHHTRPAVRRRPAALAAAVWLIVGCGHAPTGEAGGADARGRVPASAATVEHNQRVAASLPLADPQDLADARRGLIGGDGDVVIRRADGTTVWDTTAYAFQSGAAPPSANPSLWRQAGINNVHGLFQVADGVYQVRGYDVSNLTLIRGASGWIVVDPLTSVETAQAALALARQHLDPAPVVAVIFTHSHVDHFAGVRAVLPEDPAERAKVQIVAPRGFVEEATSENVLAGIAMGRRAQYMYGLGIEVGPRGHIDTGLGKQPAAGTLSFAVPTTYVDHTPQPMTIDGVDFVFQYVPDSEAPAELAFYLPKQRAYGGAEIVSHTMHNLYTLRGAKVRDALKWSGYIDQALQLFPDAEVVFASHHWPVWDRERVRTYLKQQRDVYRYLHDQTLRLANGGATSQEIAEELELPASLQPVFANRGYYGTVRHNAKAVYQSYFGWYDGNPAHLDPLPPADAARRYVEAMGGAAAVREKAQAAYDRGEYRWAAMLLDHAVFADPDDGAARQLLAQTYDQLGYQQESGPWRDVYLSGADELRHGVGESDLTKRAAGELLLNVPAEQFLVAMAARLDGPKAEGKTATINFIFTDLNESYVLTLENSVLHYRRGAPDPNTAATVRLTRPLLVRLATGQAGLRDLVFSDELSVDGSRLALVDFLRLFDNPSPTFPIVTP